MDYARVRESQRMPEQSGEIMAAKITDEERRILQAAKEIIQQNLTETQRKAARVLPF
jgi:hypothetical protein